MILFYKADSMSALFYGLKLVKKQKTYNNRNKDEKNKFFNRLIVPFCILTLSRKVESAIIQLM